MNDNNLKVFVIFVFSIMILLGTGYPQAEEGPEPIHLRVAKAYGVEQFEKVEAIRYVFNVRKGTQSNSRAWIWEPKRNRVTFRSAEADQEDVVYKRDELDDKNDDTLKQIDAWFINDQYWLLFPFHLAWDEFASVEAGADLHPSPMGDAQTRRIIVRYPPSGGYTPGDVYELYIDENDRIRAWVYKRGGAEEPTLIAAWKQHKSFGPLVISLDRPGKDKSFRVWFTDVAVKLAGTDEWLEAN